jgi:hypothetical protein
MQSLLGGRGIDLGLAIWSTPIRSLLPAEEGTLRPGAAVPRCEILIRERYAQKPVTLALSKNDSGENDLTRARVWLVRALVAVAFIAFGAWTLAALLYGFVSP